MWLATPRVATRPAISIRSRSMTVSSSESWLTMYARCASAGSVRCPQAAARTSAIANDSVLFMMPPWCNEKAPARGGAPLHRGSNVSTTPRSLPRPVRLAGLQLVQLLRLFDPHVGNLSVLQREHDLAVEAVGHQSLEVLLQAQERTLCVPNDRRAVRHGRFSSSARRNDRRPPRGWRSPSPRGETHVAARRGLHAPWWRTVPLPPALRP